MRRIGALYVEGWVGLRITQGLSFGQYIRKFPPSVAHFSEDIISSAVDNTCKPFNAICR